MKNTIQFTVIERGERQEISTYEGEYRNLMFLIADQLGVDSFGECGGQGRCATCIVKVAGLASEVIAQERNEPITLAKAGHDANDVRLSCQIYITKALNGVCIEIL